MLWGHYQWYKVFGLLTMSCTNDSSIDTQKWRLTALHYILISCHILSYMFLLFTPSTEKEKTTSVPSSLRWNITWPYPIFKKLLRHCELVKKQWRKKEQGNSYWLFKRAILSSKWKQRILFTESLLCELGSIQSEPLVTLQAPNRTYSVLSHLNKL